MDRQTAFADIEDASRKRATRREAFLEAMDAAVPWAELVAAVEPFYYPGKRGRKPMGVEKMLRMYFLQRWFNLSDEGVEAAIYDSRAFSRFMGVNLNLPQVTLVCAGDGTAARRASRVPVVHRKAGGCGRVGRGEAGQAHARDVGKGLGAAASVAAAGEVGDDILISKELGRAIIEKRSTQALSSRMAKGSQKSSMRLCSRKT